jgi:hypothetical protein
LWKLSQRPDDPDAVATAADTLDILQRFAPNDLRRAQASMDYWRLRQQNPDRQIGAIVDEVANAHDISPSTVRRYANSK